MSTFSAHENQPNPPSLVWKLLDIQGWFRHTAHMLDGAAIIHMLLQNTIGKTFGVDFRSIFQPYMDALLNECTRLTLIPPTMAALVQQAKRATNQGGYVWGNVFLHAKSSTSIIMGM